MSIRFHISGFIASLLWIEKFALLLYPSKIEVKNLLTPSALSSEDQNEIRYSRKNSEIFYRSDYDLHYRLDRIWIRFLFLFHQRSSQH